MCDENAVCDEDVVRRVIAGDVNAFRQLIEKYRIYMFKVVFSVVPSPIDAEDIVQDAFVSIYTSLPRYEMRGFKTWITRIAVNKAIDFKRNKQKQREWLSDTIEEVVNDYVIPAEQDDALWNKEHKTYMQKRLDQLPERYREVIFAFYFEELSHHEIAQRIGVKVKTVEMKLYRARQWMRKHWREEDFQ